MRRHARSAQTPRPQQSDRDASTSRKARCVEGPTTVKRVSVMIIDDHPLVREAVANVVGACKEFRVCGQADNIAEGHPCMKKERPDIVILDLALPVASGLQAIQDLKERFPKSRVLLFSGQDELTFSIRAIRMGASGYVEKSASLDVLLTALRKVAAGEIFTSEAVQKQMMDTLIRGSSAQVQSPVQRLTTREFEIFTMVGEGQSTAEIAQILGLSPKTVEAHRENIKKKLNVKSAAALLHYAIRSVCDPTTASARE